MKLIFCLLKLKILHINDKIELSGGVEPILNRFVIIHLSIILSLTGLVYIKTAIIEFSPIETPQKSYLVEN